MYGKSIFRIFRRASTFTRAGPRRTYKSGETALLPYRASRQSGSPAT